jgi:amidohydrolase
MIFIKDLRFLKDEVEKCFKHLHQIPEPGFEERETSAFVAGKLKEYGFEAIRTGVGGTGVIADLLKDSGAKTLMLRADMDCLPLQEASGVEYASKTDGRMHACGHDAHTAMLLGAANYCAAHRGELNGNVRFVFQPAEEGPMPGGAVKLIQEGVLDGVNACLAIHVSPMYPVGHLMIPIREAMASTDKFTIIIRGRGGHGAMPQAAIDPMPALSGLLAAFNSLPSRELDPLDSCVVTVGTVNTISSAWNVIPETIELSGTYRAFSAELREAVNGRLKDLAEAIPAAHRCKGEYIRDRGYEPTINDTDTVNFVSKTLSDVLGKENIELSKRPSMGGEDAGAYFQQVPGALMWLGCSPKSAENPPNLHNPMFKVDLETLLVGVCVHVNNAIAFLAQ